MFEYIADDIVMLLIERGVISVQDRELYTYGAEVFLLNLLNIVIAIGITILSGAWIHFLVFMLIFVPLRMCIGGYHAKSSQMCLIMSTLLYGASVALVKWLPGMMQSRYFIAAFLFSTVSILILAPVEHKNNPLGKKAKKTNRLLSIIFAILDSIIFAVCCYLNLVAASSIAIFIVIAGVLMIWEFVSNKLETA